VDTRRQASRAAAFAPKGGAGSTAERRAIELALRSVPKAWHVGYLPDGVHVTSTGETVVHLQQHYLGVPLYQVRRLVIFRANGRPLTRKLRKPRRIDPSTAVQPLIGAARAAGCAAHYLAQHSRSQLKASDRAARVVSQAASPSRPTVLRKRPFHDPLTAHLVLLLRRFDVRLAWVVHLVAPLPGAEFEVLVSADAPEPAVLLARRVSACAEGRARVYDSDQDATSTRDFPLPPAEYPSSLAPPAGFPWSWLACPPICGKTADCAADSACGNNVVVVGHASKTFTGRRAPSGELELMPSNAKDQRFVNAFYVCNLLHDFFYLLGFDEPSGNFQRANRNCSVGIDDDRLRVRIYDSASFDPGLLTEVRLDGTSPTMHLSLKSGRHAALDDDVLIHEYTHGVTGRLIGGRSCADPLAQNEQGEAMGEGYSDYFALTIRNYYRRKAGRPESRVFGAWIARDAAKGLRRQPYDATFAGTYADLGKAGFQLPHEAGQVWCFLLLLLRDELVKHLGTADAGDAAAWQLVMKSLPFTLSSEQGPKGDESGPNFLDGKRALLLAFDVLAGTFGGGSAALRDNLERRFAQLGMAAAARSSGSSYAGIKAAF
jgi:extracellular elastinolytic metalloproteinase